MKTFIIIASAAALMLSTAVTRVKASEEIGYEGQFFVCLTATRECQQFVSTAKDATLKACQEKIMRSVKEVIKATSNAGLTSGELVYRASCSNSLVGEDNDSIEWEERIDLSKAKKQSI